MDNILGLLSDAGHDTLSEHMLDNAIEEFCLDEALKAPALVEGPAFIKPLSLLGSDCKIRLITRDLVMPRPRSDLQQCYELLTSGVVHQPKSIRYEVSRRMGRRALSLEI